jgi:hypothetical protein
MAVIGAATDTRGFIAVLPGSENSHLVKPWSLEWWMTLGAGSLLAAPLVLGLLIRHRVIQPDKWAAHPVVRWRYFTPVVLTLIVVTLVSLPLVFPEQWPELNSALRRGAGPLLVLGAGGLVWYGVWGLQRWRRGQGSLEGPVVALVLGGFALCVVVAYAVWHVLEEAIPGILLGG